ncbi:MAG TPA: hypothetical protein QF624_08225 [Dehalococcoidia bacterium]|nr:hypothetical protein [Dehalococcoidia bacterium]
MVAEAQTAAESAAVRGRARRQREEEVLVWPDLVFVEFIAAMVFGLAFTLLAIFINAPLQDRANPAHTPNPSKAPWYFLNLQEMLLHMHPALAGVIVPTVALIALGAIPYFDNDNEHQGEWLKSPDAWKFVRIGAVTGAIGSLILILWDGGKHVVLWAQLTGNEVSDWPTKLNWMRNARSLQIDINWPSSWEAVPLGSKVLRTDLLGLPAVDLDVNIPAMIVEQILPANLMIGLPVLLSAVLWKLGIAHTRRDHMIVQFSGFVAVFLTLTIIGTFFRGLGMELFWFWEVSPAVS